MNKPQPRHVTRGGQLLLRWLAMRDMTPSALAERLRFSAATINRYVRGTSKPRYADRVVLWAATGTPVRAWDQEPEP